jgi:hypothetical protein
MSSGWAGYWAVVRADAWELSKEKFSWSSPILTFIVVLVYTATARGGSAVNDLIAQSVVSAMTAVVVAICVCLINLVRASHRVYRKQLTQSATDTAKIDDLRREVAELETQLRRRGPLLECQIGMVATVDAVNNKTTARETLLLLTVAVINRGGSASITKRWRVRLTEPAIARTQELVPIHIGTEFKIPKSDIVFDGAIFEKTGPGHPIAPGDAVVGYIVCPLPHGVPSDPDALIEIEFLNIDDTLASATIRFAGKQLPPQQMMHIPGLTKRETRS